MGFDTNRFVGEVNSDLICSICNDVLEDPVQRSSCEHYFCRQCIAEWMERQQVCPIDREPLTADHLQEVPRIVKSLLNNLELVCEFKNCQTYVKLELLKNHTKWCPFDPNAKVQCLKGCGSEFKRSEESSHSCVSFLLNLMEERNGDIETLRGEKEKTSEQLNKVKEENEDVKTKNRRLMKILDKRNETIASFKDLKAKSDTEREQVGVENERLKKENQRFMRILKKREKGVKRGIKDEDAVEYPVSASAPASVPELESSLKKIKIAASPRPKYPQDLLDSIGRMLNLSKTSSQSVQSQEQDTQPQPQPQPLLQETTANLPSPGAATSGSGYYATTCLERIIQTSLKNYPSSNSIKVAKTKKEKQPKLPQASLSSKKAIASVSTDESNRLTPDKIHKMMRRPSQENKVNKQRGIRQSTAGVSRSPRIRRSSSEGSSEEDATLAQEHSLPKRQKQQLSPVDFSMSPANQLNSRPSSSESVAARKRV